MWKVKNLKAHVIYNCRDHYNRKRVIKWNMTLRFERWGFRIHLEATVIRGGTTTTGRLRRGGQGSFAKDWLGVPKNTGKPFQLRWRVREGGRGSVEEWRG